MSMRPGGGLGRGMRNFMTEEEKANAPKVTKELLVRIFSWLKPYYVQFLLTCCASSYPHSFRFFLRY